MRSTPEAIRQQLTHTPPSACPPTDVPHGRFLERRFVDWWNSDTATKKKGSIAGRLAEARDKAFKAELDAGSPMGKMLAAKAEAEAKAKEQAAKVDPELLAMAGGAAAAAAGGMGGKVGKASQLAQKAQTTDVKALKSQVPMSKTDALKMARKAKGK